MTHDRTETRLAALLVLGTTLLQVTSIQLGPSCAAAEPSRLQLSVPQKVRPDLQAAVDDLRAALKQMTGAEFSTTTEDVAKSIRLTRADDPQAPPEAVKLLPEDSREACVVWPDGNAKLWIVARSDTGLSHAIYLYLEQLGCRWYFPSKRWTIIPHRDDIRLSKAIAASPAFRSRQFAGSGGFGGNLPLDPQRHLQARWTDWQRRNRFGGEFRVAGHSGEAFNLKHKTELEAHPEWRAMVDGQRVPWSLIAKFCAGNDEVVDLYVKDRLDDYRQRRARDAEDPHSWAVSVEPADGGGHCTAPESLALGTVSDRVFHVANRVAKAVDKEFPGGHVSLFAYNEHAAVPTIPVEPNVYVQVIPYAFQRTGLTPDQLLDAWSQKVSRMGVYDYWSTPDWSHDLPTFDPLGFGPDRLRGWHRRGVDSFLCESTYSSGAMGPAWYIASRLAWQPDADVDSLFDEFLHDCFGPAASPMRRMLTRWSNGFYLTSHELALSFRDVQEALNLTEQNPAAAARVADYGRYVVYLRLYFEHQLAKRGSDEHRAAAERLMRYLWSIYDSSMIHAFRLSQLLARDERLAGHAELSQTFDWQNRDAPGWKQIQPTPDDEVHALVKQGVAELKPQDFVSRRFEGPLVRLATTPEESTPDRQAPVLVLNNSLEFDVLSDHADFVFRPRIAAEASVQLLVTGPDGKSVAAQSVVTGANWRTEWSTPEVILPRPGLYRLQIVSQKRTFRFSPPPEVPLTMPGWTNSQGTPTPKLHFYVPADIDRLAIYTNYIAAGPPRFFDPSGAEVRAELVDHGHLMIIPVAAEHRGKVWSLDRAKCPIGPLVMVNAAAAFAFSPESLLVPQDALPQETPQPLLHRSKRVLFLGDSITASGRYVAAFDAWLSAGHGEQKPEILNAGLPSETVSGLSEDGHAGGRFPRPDLAQRLDRVLALTRPDLVVACYGINCGIYQPFGQERFSRYQQGIERLRTAVRKQGATLILMTPPFYDDQRSSRGFSYNAVLDRYSQWLLDQRKEGWLVVDLHGPMTREVQQRRGQAPQFTFQPDGVHPNEAGHWLIAQQLIRFFGDEQSAAATSVEAMLSDRRVSPELLPLVQKRLNLLRDAYVGAAGHKRPGVAAGLPLSEAQSKAQELSAEIKKLLPQN